jgi:transcription initiation factor TFIIB
MDDIWNLLSDLKNQDKNIFKLSDNEDENICISCYSTNIILEDDNYICKTCNCITSKYIDSQAEWRYYGNDDNKSSDPTRCGAPVNDLLPDSSLGSIISCQMFESQTMRLIRKYHTWNSMTYKERSLYNIFDNITVNAVNSGIPQSIIEEAKNLYKKLSESKISRGDNRSGLIASSIYMSCKTNKVPRSAKEIAKIFNLKTTTMTKGCKKFQDLMKIDLDSTNANDFIERFCSKLNISSEIRELCKHIIQKSIELNVVSSNTPPSIAAATIYMSIIITNTDISKKQISLICEISQVTLSKCYKKLYEYRSVLLPPDVIFKYSVK